MLQKLGEYVSNKYGLKCDIGIDLVIYSNNVCETITVTTIENQVLIKYNDFEIKSCYKDMYRDLRYVLDNLAYVYFLDNRGDISATLLFQNNNDKTLIEEVEDYIWENKKNIEIDKMMVITFANNYSFEAKISGSFIDTFWPVFDKAHYDVLNNVVRKYKYKGQEDYLIANKNLMSAVISNDINIHELKKYFLSLGYAFLVDYKDDEQNVYQIIDINFESLKNIAGNTYLIISADYNSVIYFYNDSIYIRGDVVDTYKNMFKVVQVGDEICNYVHNIKTSRIKYQNKLYEATGKTLSDELNKLNKMLGYKMMCCFSCKYGNYIDNECEIHCLKDFKPKDFSDVLYIVDEGKILPYDPFNYCDDYEEIEKNYYTSTKFKKE